MTASATGSRNSPSDPVHVRADEVQQDAEDQAADDGTDRRVHPAEDSRRKGVQQDRLHHVRLEKERRCGEHSRDRAERGCEPPADGQHRRHLHAGQPRLERVAAVARMPSPIFVRLKSSPMKAAPASDTPITPRSCFGNATPPTWMGAVENGP